MTRTTSSKKKSKLIPNQETVEALEEARVISKFPSSSDYKKNPKQFTPNDPPKNKPVTDDPVPEDVLILQPSPKEDELPEPEIKPKAKQKATPSMLRNLLTKDADGLFEDALGKLQECNVANLPHDRLSSIMTSAVEVVQEIYQRILGETHMNPGATEIDFPISDMPVDMPMVLMNLLERLGYQVITDRDSYIRILLPPVPILAQSIIDIERRSSVNPL